MTARIWGVYLSVSKLVSGMLLFLFITIMSMYNLMPTWLLLSAGIALMVRLLFPYRSLNAWVGQTATFYVMCLMAGGGVVAAAPYVDWPMPALAMCSFVGGSWIIRKVLSQMGEVTRVEKECRSVAIRWRESQVDVKAFVDTGNLLSDPWTGRGVCLAEEEVFLEWFTEKELSDMRECSYVDSPFSFIPFQAAGSRGESWMPVLKVDELSVDGRTWKGRLVGLHPGKLAAHHSYQMLLHPDTTKE